MSDAKSLTCQYHVKSIQPVEVWGNYKTKLKFLNKSGEIIYSRNSWYHQLNTLLRMDLIPLVFVHWTSDKDIAIVNECDNTFNELTLLDFNARVLYRISLINNNSFSQLPSMLNSELVNYLKENGIKSKFIIEKIKSPLFSCWKER